MDAKNGYKIIFVDLGKTLCAFDHSVRLRAISAASGAAINRVQAEILASGFDDKCDSGAYARTEICAAIRDRLSIQTVDQRLAELQTELRITQTARNAYANALRSLLPKPAPKAKPKAKAKKA